MMKLTWTKLMSVGNESIDYEHKTLISMVNDIERAIRARNAAALLQAFKLFEASVHLHFRNEGRIAEAIDYPFETHKLEHQYVLNEIQIMKKELLSNGGKWSESSAEHYYGFLSKWTTMHIAEDDMQMKEILDTYPYDFKPPETPK
jgi:hemerythrin